MATIVGTNGNDSWTVIDPGTFVIDGLDGVDTIDFGTMTRSDFEISRGSDGEVFVDTLSGASQLLHATLFNVELLQFDNRRVSVDLRLLFGDGTAPTVAIGDDASGTARGSIVFTLQFSEAVSGLAADDFTIANGALQGLSIGSLSATATVLPAADFEGTLTLTLRAAAVSDGSGNALAAASSVTQAVDTRAPLFAGSTPAAGSYGADTGASLALQFSETILEGSGLVVVKDGNGVVAAQWDLARAGDGSTNGGTLLLTPPAPLPAGSALFVELPAGALTDLAGNPLATAVTFGFYSATDASGQLAGSAAADVIPLHASQRSIDGREGVDTVIAGGERSAFTLSARAAGGFTLAGGGANVDLSNIERLQFSDSRLALDLDPAGGPGGHAAQVAMILGAVFGRDSVHNAFFVGIGLSLLDGGMSFEALTQLALDVRLGAGFTSGPLVDLLYTNLIGVPPAEQVKAEFQQLVDGGALTPVLLGVIAATHGINLANIDLAGLAATGLPYT